MSPIRVLIADDHTILRDGIRLLLSAQPDIQVVGEAVDGRDAVAKARDLKPDLILMDIAMPRLNGLEATRQILQENPDIAVLVLTMHDSQEYVVQILEAGAAGYVLKKAASSELVSAIRAVAQGDAFLYPSITKQLIEDYLRRMQVSADHADVEKRDVLTDREREILQLIAEGYTSAQIAEMLNLSIKTVRTHRAHIMEKLDLHDRSALVKYALQKGITHLE